MDPSIIVPCAAGLAGSAPVPAHAGHRLNRCGLCMPLPPYLPLPPPSRGAP